MKYQFQYLAILSCFLFISCKNDQKTKDANALLFPQGDKNTNDNFRGNVWVKSLIDADSVNETAVGNVTFAPGARSNWHAYPAGQILLAISGVGYYQEKGKQRQILRKGDVIKCPPHLAHWHGASPDTAFVQIAITSRQNGPTSWMKPVTEKEYNNLKAD